MVLLRLSDNKKEWIVISEEEKQEGDLYLPLRLKNVLDKAIAHMKKNNDFILLICGDEGSGKSALAGNCMEYVSFGNFDPVKEVIGHDIDDAYDKIEKSEKGSRLMFDEGNVFFLSTEVMKKEQRELHKIFSIFRQRNLFVTICLPSFFRMGSYFSVDRSKILLRTYLKNGKRGNFAFYSRKRKDLLYRIGKKDHNYNSVRPNWRAKFTRCEKLEDKEYLEVKDKTFRGALNNARERKEKPLSVAEMRRNYVRQRIMENMDMNERLLSNALGVSISTVQKAKRDIKDHKLKLFSIPKELKR